MHFQFRGREVDISSNYRQKRLTLLQRLQQSRTSFPGYKLQLTSKTLISVLHRKLILEWKSQLYNLLRRQRFWYLCRLLYYLKSLTTFRCDPSASCESSGPFQAVGGVRKCRSGADDSGNSGPYSRLGAELQGAQAEGEGGREASWVREIVYILYSLFCIHALVHWLFFFACV